MDEKCIGFSVGAPRLRFTGGGLKINSRGSLLLQSMHREQADQYVLAVFVVLLALLPSWPHALGVIAYAALCATRVVIFKRHDDRVEALTDALDKLTHKVEQLQNVVGLKSFGQR